MIVTKIIHNEETNTFYAEGMSGKMIELYSTNYHDAVLEADLIEEVIG